MRLETQSPTNLQKSLKTGVDLFRTSFCSCSDQWRQTYQLTGCKKRPGVFPVGHNLAQLDALPLDRSSEGGLGMLT